MRDLLTELLESWHAGDVVAVGTVVGTQRSAPRPPGAAMLVMADGSAVGSVSGGCVEGAVYELAETVVADGTPVLQRFGFSDEEAFAVGLTCGGIIDVFVEPVSVHTFPELERLADDVHEHRPVAIATVIEHPDAAWVGRRLVVRPDPGGGAGPRAAHDAVEGTLGNDRADAAVIDDARGLLVSGASDVVTYGPEGERMESGMRVFVSSFQSPPRMMVFGAIDFAAAVARQGKLLGYDVSVCDARPTFATHARFPEVDDVVVSWPHHYLQHEIEADRIDGRTVICVLTHDPKFDVPVLDLALRLDGANRPAFVGAMGSRKTHEDRLERLREAGLTDEHFARLSSPIGLDLGGRTPEETAVSVAAEIVARRWGGTGQRLSDTKDRVHGPQPG